MSNVSGAKVFAEKSTFSCQNSVFKHLMSSASQAKELTVAAQTYENPDISALENIFM